MCFAVSQFEWVAGQRPSVLVSHFGLLQRSVGALPVDHAEGDALGLRREGPGDGGTGRAHDDGDGAVTAGLDEKLPAAVPKAGDVIDCEGDIKPATQPRGAKEDMTDMTMKQHIHG